MNDIYKLTIYKNSIEIFSQELSEYLIIKNIKFEQKYLYFENHIPGGSAGNHSVDYYVLDLNKLHINILNYSCRDFSYEFCEFDNLDEIKKDTELYKFYMRTIPKHNPKDNYFDEK
jgi:hypothetical protein